MDAARWLRMRDILEQALEHESAEREAFVRRICGEDRGLGDEILKLLASDVTAGVLEPAATGWPRATRVPDTSMIGARVGHYRILRLIGYGGMGAVYEAEQDQPRRTVALKVMRPSLATPHALRRFEFESQVLARLRHPSIAAVFEAGTHNPDPADPSRAVPYFAMELVQGAQPITEFARARSLSMRDKLELFAQVCDAVHHGHQQGVIHRDLKPGNVLVDGDGRPRIIDFGIARTLEPDPAGTGTGAQVLGTLQYMSPEQCGETSDGIDTRSDVYSLGVLLYELLAGHAPNDVSSTSIVEAMRRVREVNPPLLGQFDRALRGDVETIVRTALEKSRENRYPAAASLAADIRRYLRSEPISARPPTAMYHLRTFARRNKPLVASAAIVLVVLLVGIVATSLAWRSSDQEARRARRIANFYKDTITAGTPYLSSNLFPDSEWWEDTLVPRLASPQAAGSFAVPDLLELVSSRLEVTFADEPLIRGELQDTLGRTLVNMSRWRGMELLQQAIKLREQTLGQDHPDTIRTRVACAVRTEAGGNYLAAETEFRVALASCVRRFGADDPRTIAVERRLSSCISWIDRAKSFEAAKAVLEHARRALGDDHRETLVALGGYANALAGRGELRKAEEVSRDQLARWRRVSGDDSLETAQAHLTLSTILTSERSLTEAETELRTGLSLLRERFGDDILRTRPLELQRVSLLRRMKRSGEALTEMRRVLDALRAAFGEGHTHCIKLESTLARLGIEAGEDLEEAERLARHAAETLTAQLNYGDLNTVMAVDTLNCAIRARGRASEAAPLASAQLKFATGLGIAEPEIMSPLHQTLGECELDLGHLDAAASELGEAWRIAEERGAYASDPGHPRRLALMDALARLEDARGHAVEAAAWREKLSDSGRWQ